PESPDGRRVAAGRTPNRRRGKELAMDLMADIGATNTRCALVDDRGEELAAAAPIVGDEVQMLNIEWQFSQADLKTELGLNELIVCNDFAAIAWGLPYFGSADLHTVGGGQRVAGAALATL